MKKAKLLKDIFWLYFGLFLFAIGILLGVKANIGYAPWEVFYMGLSQRIGLSLGQTTILVSLIILSIVTFLKEPLGFGSISNMVFVGLFIDLIEKLGLIPLSPNFIISLLYVLLSMISLSLAMFFYISAAFGAGPNESLLILIHRKTGLEIGNARRVLEVVLTTVGWLLGGKVGVGTVLFALFTGTVMNFLFPLLSFYPKEIKHRHFFS